MALEVIIMKTLPVGIQVYSLREEAAKDFEGTMKKVKELGYDFVELAGLYGIPAAEVKAILDKIGLPCYSAHVSDLMGDGDINAVLDDYVTIGCKYVVVPYLAEGLRPGDPNFDEILAKMENVGKLAREKGMTLLYHNHDFEFIKMSGQYGLDFMYDAVCPEILKTELDCCWVKYAGEDPADYIRKYTGRAPVVHLKDYVGRKGGKQPYALINTDGSGKDDGAAADPNDIAFEFRPVGYGCQNVPSLIEAGLEAGAGWFIVEQDQWYDRHPLEAAKMSREYLKSIGI